MKYLVLSFIFSLCSCHALVVADKLYYQGTIGKKTPKVSIEIDSLKYGVTPPE